MTVDTGAPADELAGRFWEGFLERSPLYATAIGDDRYDDRLPDPGPDGRAAERAANQETLAAARAMERDGLSIDEALTLDLLEIITETGIELDDAKLYQLYAVDQLSGAQQIPSDLPRLQSVDTTERFERFLTRLAAYPELIAATIGVMEEGRADRRTAARVVVERAIAQVERLLAVPPDESRVYTGITPPEGDGRERLLEALRRHVYPSYQRYLDALLEYRPSARERIGLWSTPGAEEAYRASIKQWTTLDEDPEDLHAFGLARLEEIDGKRSAIAARLGRSGWRELLAELDADPENHARAPEELVTRAADQVARATAAAPGYFSRLPRAECVVEAVEAYREQDAPFAFYLPPSRDLSRPGHTS